MTHLTCNLHEAGDLFPGDTKPGVEATLEDSKLVIYTPDPDAEEHIELTPGTYSETYTCYTGGDFYDLVEHTKFMYPTSVTVSESLARSRGRKVLFENRWALDGHYITHTITVLHEDLFGKEQPE